MPDKPTPCCERCAFWEKHGKECWYYWELKKNCTMHSDNSNGLQ